jgi:cellulose synthase (UDP-forming)
MLGWFDSWRTLGYLLIPPVVLFTGAMPITADATTFLVVFLATFIIQRIALSLLSRGYFRGQLQIVFELVRMAPSLLATLTLFRSTPARFQVTPKGRVGNARRRVKVPNLLYALIVLSAGALVWFTLAITGRSAVTYSVPFAAYGAALWLVVNAWFTVAAIRRIRSDAFGTERRAGVRFGTELSGSLNGIPCSVQDLSLSGAKVLAPIGALLDEFAVLTIDSAGLAAGFEVRLRSMHPFELGGNVYGLAFAPGQYLERGRLALAL